MSTRALADDISFAHRLADAASRTAMPYFGRATRTEIKADGSPVGEADVAVDRELLRLIADERRGDAVLSEESGPRGDAARRWIVDPIDGTVAFLEGAPQWGTHVALEDGGRMVVGVVTRPVLGLRWWASAGGGAFRGRVEGGVVTAPEPLRTSDVADVRDARVAGWAVDDEVDAGPLAALRAAGHWVDVAYNDLLAVVDGRADAMVVPGKLWDHAPFAVLLGEAGGSVIDPLGGARLDLGWVVFTNGHVDDQIREVITQGRA